MDIDQLKEKLRIVAELKDAVCAEDMMVGLLLDYIDMPDYERAKNNGETPGEFAKRLLVHIVDDQEVAELIGLITNS